MLRTKNILKSISPLDGKRISIMSRHTLANGKTPDARITPYMYDEWRLEFAPPDKLVRAYYKRKLPWKEYEIEYLKHIRTPGITEKVKELARASMITNITLLCIEDFVKGEMLHCHRRLLAEECKKYQPELKLYIR